MLHLKNTQHIKMNIQNASLADIASGLRNKTITAQSIMEQCNNSYQKHEPVSNAYKTWAGEQALAQARHVDNLISKGVFTGPLMGIPSSVKDLFGVPGMPTFAGSSAALPQSWEQAGGVVKSLIKQAAPITGKTHTVEFAFGGIGINSHWGTPHNPWDKNNHRIPGGSSSGAGVSLLQGSALLALGTDTAGSVRIPASYAGVVSLKLTQGRWPQDGAVPLSFTLDTPGILTRTVQDAIYAFCAMDSTIRNSSTSVREAGSLHGIKVGIPGNFFWDDTDPSIEKAVRDVIPEVSKLGASVVDTIFPGCDPVYEIFKAGGLGASELSSFLNINMPEKIDQLDPMVKIRVEGADNISSVEYLRRCNAIIQASKQAEAYFNDFDILITPTIAISAPTVSELENIDVYRNANMMVLRNTSIANLMGFCGLSMPIGLDSNGIPVGLQLMAGPGKEELLLSVAALLEQTLGNGQQILGTAPLFS